MEPKSLVQLAASGNTVTVEKEWMNVVESPEAALPKLATYHVVLTELRRAKKGSMAAELAWAALESLSERFSPQDILTVAGPFLLAVGDHEDLRAQVTDLYRAAYPDREGLETLLSKAGIAGGRPVRRALRTLEVCLALAEGDYLAARDEDRAARVEAIDPSTCEFTINVGSSSQTLDPVQLADTYQPAPPTNFRVMRQFAVGELVQRLHDDPVAVVVDICLQRRHKIDSDVLQSLLVPKLFSENEWKKWWPRARTALKRCPNITLEGRSPYSIVYHEVAIAPEDTFLSEFETLHDPAQRLALVERYVRDCKARRTKPSKDALRHCYDRFRQRAQQLSEQGAGAAGQYWVIAARVGELAGMEEPVQAATDYIRHTSDLRTLFGHLDSEALVKLACRCLAEARPDDWQDQLLTLLPTCPMAVCDLVARELIDAGRTPTDFDVALQQILASPIKCFEALLWLWDGPTGQAQIDIASATAILTRILRTLEDARLSEEVPREAYRTMCARARTVLSARKHERFVKCTDGLEPSMARALRTQIARGEGLGIRVRDDLVREIDRQVPAEAPQAEPQPWEREDVLYVTQAGLAKKEAEIEHHVNVKMAENARAIGRAAERGDLSENSEYKFALEERDLLRARLAQMNEEVAQADVLRPDEVPMDHIGIGTRVVFRRLADGERYEMTFAGPWEANADKGWFNYRAPLSQSLMGKRVGEVVEFDHSGVVGPHEIESVHNALTE